MNHIALVLLIGIFFTMSIGIAHAELLAFNPYVIEGSGFAVTEESIKSSQIDLALSVGNVVSGRGSFTVEDGFVTLNQNDYVIDNITGTILREGKFIRIAGTANNFDNEEITIRLFGRLIQDSKDGSIYSFTGRIIENNISHSIIYTSKISGFEITPQVSQPQELISEKNKVLLIMPGSYNQGFGSDYIDAGQLRSEAAKSGQDLFRARYFSQDRLTLEPGTTITVQNNDSVSHSILSGKENYNSRYDKFTADDRISTGVILPGQSIEITFTDMGFYRLYDPDYQWMQIVVYSFPDVDNITFGETKNQQGN